ncbi:MAG: small basic protein [Phycisphaerae bacterium]|nr:small basic protein [Phycisphaerae bacterium]
MTMDRSLKNRGGLKGSRSVLTRDERIAKMIEEGNFDVEKNSPLGLPKLVVKQSRAGSKAKKEAAEETTEEGTEEAAPEAAAE